MDIITLRRVAIYKGGPRGQALNTWIAERQAAVVRAVGRAKEVAEEHHLTESPPPSTFDDLARQLHDMADAQEAAYKKHSRVRLHESSMRAAMQWSEVIEDVVPRMGAIAAGLQRIHRYGPADWRAAPSAFNALCMRTMTAWNALRILERNVAGSHAQRSRVFSNLSERPDSPAREPIALTREAAKLAESARDQLGNWYEGWGLPRGGVPFTLPPKTETVNRTIAGFPCKIVDYVDNAVGRDYLTWLDAALRTYRQQADRWFPAAVRYQLPFEVHFTKPSRGEAANCRAGVRIAVFLPLMKAGGIPWAVHVLAHEIGHHLYRRVLTDAGRTDWDAAVSGKAKLTSAEIIAAIRASGEQGTTEVFWAWAKEHDPSLWIRMLAAARIQQETTHDQLPYRQRTANDPDNPAGHWLDWYLNRPKKTFQVPAMVTTVYGASNPEEAFCEVLGSLVAYGPKTVLEPLRDLMYRLLPGLRRNPVELASG